MAEQRTRIVAGCMTGTSLDGLDVALVKITGTGLAMQAQLLGHRALSMPEGLRATLMSLASGQANEPIVYMRAARALGQLHADGLDGLLADGLDTPITPGKITAADIDFVTAHGQTIWHAPRTRDHQDEAQHDPGPMSWQLLDPWPIVRRLKRPVCYDLRQADLIAGGEGAPLTPIADWVMYRDKAEVVFNLGGICNATWLRGPDPMKIRGFDLFPCNLILNGIAERMLGVPYDQDGSCARGGHARPKLVKAIKKFAIPSEIGAYSQGRESMSSDWFDRVIATDPQATAGDVMASAIEVLRQLTCSFVFGMEEADISIVFAGGGVRNPVLMEGFREELKPCGSVAISDDLGIPCEAREAMGFAVLGALSQDGVPISLPQVTGAEDPGVAGVWAYP